MSTTPSEQTNAALQKQRKEMTTLTLKMAEDFCKRIRQGDSIALAKESGGSTALPIYLPEREEELRAKCRIIARKYDVDQDMMDLYILYLIFVSSSAQKELLNRSTTLDKNTIDPKILHNNLLTLTASIAQAYGKYDAHAYGTHFELMREQEILTDLIGLMRDRDTALNLGCATGTFVTETLGKCFQHVIGYDISQEMITQAQKNFPDHEFHCRDLSSSIPYKNASVDLLVANLGAASEVTKEIWAQAQRLLRPGGFGYFSFYNKDALSTQWQTSRSNAFRIMVNIHNDTISVPFVDSAGSPKALWIHGRSLTEKEVRSNAKNYGFEIWSIESSGPQWDNMPPWFFRCKEAVAVSCAYDQAHGHIPPYLGPYINVCFCKR